MPDPIQAFAPRLSRNWIRVAACPHPAKADMRVLTRGWGFGTKVRGCQQPLTFYGPGSIAGIPLAYSPKLSFSLTVELSVLHARLRKAITRRAARADGCQGNILRNGTQIDVEVLDGEAGTGDAKDRV